MFEVVKQPMRIGPKVIEFETVRRAPGVRLIVVQNGKILISREYRSEQGGWDYRLPRGKVFDTLADYRKHLAANADIMHHAEQAGKRELEEETGLRPKKLRHIYTTTRGASIIRDLFYFVVEDFEEGERKLDDGEVIHPEWKSFEDVKRLCLDGSVKEEQTVAVLLRFLSNEFK